MSNRFIIAGVHTGIGKTIVSAVICQATGCHYWKPVQAGFEEGTDSNFIRSVVTHPNTIVHPERFLLNTPMSPHEAARIDGLQIQPEDFSMPQTDAPLLIETAGGLMSPLASGFLNIDLIRQLQLPVLFVTMDYLGSINHTLLSLAALNAAGIPVRGLIFSGSETASSREFIRQHTALPELFSIPLLPELSSAYIQQAAQAVPKNLFQHE